LTATAVLQLQEVSKKMGKRTIVDRLNLSVQRGEIFGLLGPNGAGKTTVIRMITGLLSLSQGEITICGHSVSRQFEQAIRHVGAIVENPEMYKFLSGYDNLRHYARMMRGISERRIEDTVRLVGLEERIFDKVKTYSLGMRQRLGVAQAVLHRPDLLILDEPTNGLDPAGIRELRDYLRKMADDEGVAVIVSSHLLAEMELMCDRVAIIDKGKLIGERTVKSGSGEPVTEQRFVRFEVDRPAAARQLFGQPGNASAASAAVDADSHEVEFTGTKEQIAEANARLIADGIKVYGIRPVNKTLEQTFLEMTGGGTK
jgi:ABC-2 type transport system ATP-binding protein